MATIGRVNAVFTASTGGLKTGINQAMSSFQSMERSISSLRGNMRLLAGIEVGRIAIGGIRSIASAFVSAAQFAINYSARVNEAIDATNDLAQRTGIAVEALQAFQIAGKLTGVDVTAGVQKLAVAIGQAATQGQAGAAKFAALGLNLAQLQRLAPADQFRAVAGAIASLSTPAERAAAAVRLFGRSGVALLPAFAELPEIEARLQKLNVVLSGNQVKAIDEMGDAFTMVRATIDGIVGQVNANLSPVMTSLANEFLRFVEAYKSATGVTGGRGIAGTITESLSAGLASFLEIVRSAGNGLLTFLHALGLVAERAAKLFGVNIRSEQEKDVIARLGRNQELQRQLTRGQSEARRRGATDEDLAQNRAARLRLQAEEEDLLKQLAAMRGEGLIDTIRAGFNAAVDAAERGLGKATAEGQPAGGTPPPPEPATGPQAVKIEGLDRALQAVDSRSTEGVAEMFRIMRGNSEDVQERMADSLDEIVKNTRDMGVDLYETDIATA